jgi:hypothetical protein
MKESDQDVEEIDPPIIKQNKCKKYRRRILIEPLDPYFAIAAKEMKSKS